MYTLFSYYSTIDGMYRLTVEGVTPTRDPVSGASCVSSRNDTARESQWHVNVLLTVL